MATYHVENFGCRATQADGASIERQLLERGLLRAGSANEAEVVVLNTCTVTASADQDARAIAAFLERTGIGGGAAISQPIVLVNDQVTRAGVDRAFGELLHRVRGRPEDTVVVFLAGHTAVPRGLFGLLLPTAELPAGPDRVALRGPVGDLPRGVRSPLPTDDPTVAQGGREQILEAYRAVRRALAARIAERFRPAKS